MRFKKVMVYDPRERVYRIGRWLWQKGKVGVPGGGYSAKFSLGLTPRLFAFKKGWHEYLLVLFGVRLHYMRSYGGIIPAIAILAALSASPAFAANHHCVTGHCAPVVAQQVAYPQTIIQNQTILYSVGEEVRKYAVTPQAVAEANKQYLARQIQGLQDQLEEYQSQQSYTQPQVCYVPMPVQQQAQPHCAPAEQPQQPQQPGPFSLNAPPNALDSCIKCHDEHGKARKHFDMSSTKWLNCDDIGHAIAAIDSGEMPKGKQLSEAEKSAARAALFGWNKTRGLISPDVKSEVPPPEQPVNQAPEEGDAQEKFSALPAATQRQLLALIQKK